MPTLSKQDAWNQAAARARSGATIADIIVDADKILNYVNGTTGQTCASAAPKPVPRKVPATRYVVEYKNKTGNSFHLGKRLYLTYNAAYKNKNSRKGTLASRFVRVVTLKETV